MRLLDHAVFHIVMGVVICLNVLVVAQETNYVVSCRHKEEEACEEGFHLIRLANVGFICIYGVETCLRFYAMGLKLFTRQWLNVMDVFVIIMGTFEIASSFLMESVGVDLNVQLLRIFRALRLVRSLRLLLWIVELYQLVAGFFHAARALLWGSIMLLILIFLFAVIAVDIIHPRNKTLENVHEVRYYTILILYYTILYYTILYCTVLYCTIICYTMLCYAMLYYVMLYYTILYYTILFYAILYYTVLYYTILLLYYTILARGRLLQGRLQLGPADHAVLPAVCGGDRRLGYHDT